MITITVADTTELFEPPHPDPFAGRFSTETGVQRILDAARETREDVDEIVVHVTGAPTHVAPAVQQALQSYWAASIEKLHHRRRRIWSRGSKELAVGVLFLAACLALSASLASASWRTEWFGQFAIEGVIIVGWIALWHPVDMLLFEPWPLNSELRALRRLTAARVRLDVH